MPPYHPPTPVQGPDFLQQFMAGFQMAHHQREQARRDELLRQEQEREMFDRQQRQEHLKLQKQEVDLRLKRAKQEDAIKQFELRQQTVIPPDLPQPTAQDVGVQQAVPDVGPPVGQINVPQPTQAIPSVDGGPDVQLPIMTGRQQTALQDREEQRKMRAALGMEKARLDIAEPYETADDERAARLAAQRDAAAERRIDLREAARSQKQKGDATKLRKEYNDQIKPYLPQIDNYRKAEALALKPTDARTAADDMSLVFIFMRSLDPGSTVREGEYATAKNTAGVPDKIRNAYNQAVNGQFLTPQQRADFAGSIKRDFDAGPGRRAAQLQQRYDFLSREAGIDPSLVLMDDGIASGAPAAPADSGGGWQDINGVRVRVKR